MALAKTIYECRKLAEIAKEYNVVSQMGNQGHASEGTRILYGAACGIMVQM
jgi:hypothetical protein